MGMDVGGDGLDDLVLGVWSHSTPGSVLLNQLGGAHQQHRVMLALVRRIEDARSPRQSRTRGYWVEKAPQPHECDCGGKENRQKEVVQNAVQEAN